VERGVAHADTDTDAASAVVNMQRWRRAND
jgi:hypothetical protein